MGLINKVKQSLNDTSMNMTRDIFYGEIDDAKSKGENFEDTEQFKKSFPIVKKLYAEKTFAKVSGRVILYGWMALNAVSCVQDVKSFANTNYGESVNLASQYGDSPRLKNTSEMLDNYASNMKSIDSVFYEKTMSSDINKAQEIMNSCDSIIKNRIDSLKNTDEYKNYESDLNGRSSAMADFFLYSGIIAAGLGAGIKSRHLILKKNLEKKYHALNPDKNKKYIHYNL